MSERFEWNLKRVNSSLRLKDSLTGNVGNWIAWWYCGIYKNQQAGSQPNVLVAFRELWDSGYLSDDFILRRVPLSTLGHVRLGTVWQNGVCRREAEFDTCEFDVDYRSAKWQFSSFHYASQNNIAPPYPFTLYPLRYKSDRNWLIEFDLETGGKLIIPCLEFFSRCYGRSVELRRVLATYPWYGTEGGDGNRLYAPLDQPEEDGKWKVKLRKRLANGDVLFLAHVKYDRYAESRAKQIYAQIEALHDPSGKYPAFLRVGPWFKELARLKVKGIWFENRKSFLGLQIVGASDPSGVPIERSRDNRNNAEQPADIDSQKQAWQGATGRSSVTPPQIIDLTKDNEPDQSAGSIEVEEPKFEVLGTQRLVTNYRDKQAKDTAGSKLKGDGSESYSTGEHHGEGKGVGYASIRAEPVMESQGVMRDMWNAIVFLSEAHPRKIRKVEWFTFEDGYSSDKEPKLIALESFDADESVQGDEELPRTILNWPYIDRHQSKLRGVLVARLSLPDKSVHIVEIQRRRKRSATGISWDSEESFRGLVFVLNDQKSFECWLRTLLSRVRHVTGVFQKLVNDCPGDAASFQHRPAKKERVPCERAVLLALEKIGFVL
ncbi:hypothetical protein [Marinobacter sp. C2H3]|uniref:hypothetical protein n=1 Tax=Marinobacter sp. C2H3 TaxID=3119003 RepID=UPI00300E7F57